MKRFLVFALSLAAVCALNLLPQSAPEAHAYSFTVLDAPGAGSTIATGINGSGDVAGYYNDATGWHGFLYNGSSYTALNYPGADYTYAYGINGSGNVVGSYGYLNSGMLHGFVATAEPGDPTYHGTVPEPSTLLLLGSGMTGLMAMKRFRFRK